jgi:hypothetical protein
MFLDLVRRIVVGKRSPDPLLPSVI